MTAHVKGVKPAGSYQSAGLSHWKPGNYADAPDWFKGWVVRPDGSLEFWRYGLRIERPEDQR